MTFNNNNDNNNNNPVRKQKITQTIHSVKVADCCHIWEKIYIFIESIIPKTKKKLKKWWLVVKHFFYNFLFMFAITVMYVNSFRCKEMQMVVMDKL